MNTKTENKICQNCKQTFTIEGEDFNFYEKIKVPAPTFCPECRLMRRLAWRNERNLYKRKCDAPGHDEMIISMYPEGEPFPVYDPKFWWSDEWDAGVYKLDLDFTKPFLAQWYELFKLVPAMSLLNLQDIDSDFCNYTFQSKNCYLNFASDMNEDTGYLYHSIQNRNCYDMLGSRKNENSYELIDSDECYGSSYLILSSNCIDSKFCYDCRGCSNCIGCVGLRNSNYCIFNKQYSQEEYRHLVDGMSLNDKIGLDTLALDFNKFLNDFPKKYSNSRHTVNSTGDYLNGVKNSKDCFDVEGPLEDSRFVVYGVTNIRNVYDGYAIGVNIENSYEVMDSGNNVGNTMFSGNVWEGYANQYCYFTENCSNCFGCIGLKNKSYCILNKQYTKEEYEELLPKLVEHMNKVPYVNKNNITYRYGEFLPVEFSPFSYNSSMAQEVFPINKDRAVDSGYLWTTKGERNYVIDLYLKDLPNNSSNVDESIVGKIIECAHGGNCDDNCTGGFKLVHAELSFYKKMNLSLPNLCPNCRHYARLAKRNPMKLWHRKCMNSGCQNEFDTTYAPDRPEKVYCESCYNKEIY